MTDGRVEMSDNNVSSQDQLYRVKFQTGQERTMKLSIAAVKYDYGYLRNYFKK